MSPELRELRTLLATVDAILRQGEVLRQEADQVLAAAVEAVIEAREWRSRHDAVEARAPEERSLALALRRVGNERDVP